MWNRSKSLDLLEIIQKLDRHSTPKNVNLTPKDPQYWEWTQIGYQARKWRGTEWENDGEASPKMNQVRKWTEPENDQSVDPLRCKMDPLGCGDS